MHGHVHAVGAQGIPAGTTSQTMIGLEKAAALRQAAAIRRSLLRAAAHQLDGDLDNQGREMAESWPEAKYPRGRQQPYGLGVVPEQAAGGISCWV